ncbi:MAG: hypothetical protein GF383_00095 [Candidatus Lokiarchaeota archaeon]|nr:hypothetical protein [Candidatus Lokiarchaeota archaeon]MBD3337494.1 hypothetical protein [Candidatus Lokiarchaeota archaeon]
MEKVIDVCTRIEGHANVNVFVKHEKILTVEFKTEVFRGFENILKGKNLMEAPKIVSRICGLCDISQTLASCKAIESMYNVKPSKQSINIRRLLLTGEMLKSHLMHFFFQSYPDLLKIFEYSHKTLDPYELIKFNPQLTTKIYELIKIGNEIDNIFGGRPIHVITAVPGGQLYKHKTKNLTLAMKYLHKAIENLEWILDHFLQLFSHKNPPEAFGLPYVKYLAINNKNIYDRYEGNFSIKRNTDHKSFSFSIDNYHDYFDKDLDPFVRGITSISDKKLNFIVGPLARFNVLQFYEFDGFYSYIDSFENSWKENLLFANFLRLFELLIECKNAITLLENTNLTQSSPLPVLKNPHHNEGLGVVEAPRGTLIHHYLLDDYKNIKQVKLFIATEINIPLINQMLTNYAKSLYEKEDINTVTRKVQTIVRAFDPCISCATH